MLLMLAVCILWKTRDVIKATLQSPTLVFAACFVVLFVGAFSLQVINLGTMTRLKINVLPFFFAFAAIALPHCPSDFSGLRRRLLGSPRLLL